MSATAIYVRISSDPSGERAGVERQREDCERLAAELGLTDLRLYDQDNDRSAFNGETREDFDRLLAEIEAGEIGSVIVWAVDRLYRRLTDLERIVTVLDGAGVPVHAVKSGDIDLSTADGRLHARLLGSVAQHESEKKSERIVRACQQRAERGRMVSSQRPFGWRHAKGGGLEPDPVEAPALAQAYRDIAAGATLRATWKRLAATVDVGKMTATTLGTILRNPRNTGLVTYRGEIVIGGDGHPVEATDGQRIVDRDLFDKVAAILNDPSRRTSPGRPANTWLGGGLLVCGKCGGNMASSSRAGAGGAKVPTYVCSKNQCMHRRRHLLDPPVLDLAGEMVAALADTGLLAVAPDPDPAMDGLRQRIRAAEDRLDGLAALLAAGDLDPAAYALGAKKVRADMDDAAAQLRRRAGRPALAKLTSEEDVQAAWQALIAGGDTDTVRALLRELLESITAEPNGSMTVRFAEWTDQPVARLEPAGPHRSDAAARREQVGALHGEGLNQSQIAGRLGCARETIRADLKALGLYTVAS